MDGSSFSELTTLSANTTSYSDSSLTPGATYYYRVRAFNDYANSSYATASCSTPAGPPAAPTGLSATAGDKQVSLSWSATGGAIGYVVKRAMVSGGPYTTVKTTTSTSCTDTGLVNLSTYFYVIAAINASGSSADSGEVSAMPKVEIQINAGGSAVSPYMADSYASGGKQLVYHRDHFHEWRDGPGPVLGLSDGT